MVERLLQDSRVDPSDQDNYAIRYACLYGHAAIVKRLLQDCRVDPDVYIRYEAFCKSSEILLLPSLRHREQVRRLLPQIVVKERLLREFEQKFTDAPPHVNKWVWEGGPGYHEGLEACFSIK